MNKITLIENDEAQSDFIVDFPLKDIAVDGKSISATNRICKQLRIICWVFGVILTAGLIYIINQNRIIIGDLTDTPEHLEVGDKVYFTKTIEGQALGGEFKMFPPGEYDVVRVGINNLRFRIEHKNIQYKIFNARDSLIKINE